MDRELKVMKHGQLLARLDFNYESEKRGRVKVLINRLLDLGDDMWSSYPLYEAEDYFWHDGKVPDTFAELKKYDADFLKKQPGAKDELTGELTYVYEPEPYRYLLKQRDTIGIADIEVNFEENTKQLKFSSAQRIRDDFPASTTAFEPNVIFIKRVSGDYLRDVYPEVHRVGYY